MFQRKSKPEQVRDSASAAKDKAVAGVGTVAGAVLTAVKDAFDDKVAPKAEAVAETASAKASEVAEQAKERASDLASKARESDLAHKARDSDLAHKAKDKAAHARDRAVSGIDQGIDAAVPRTQEAVAAVGPKVDHARDVLVDEVLPRISELLGNVQNAKNEALASTTGPVATLTGAPKKKSRKGGALILFGLAAAAGAAVAYYLNSQKKPATDPWATEHHVGGAPGVDSQVRASLANKDTATASASGTSGGGSSSSSTSTSTGSATKVGSTTAAADSTTTAGVTASTPKATDTPIADSLSKATSASGTSAGDSSAAAALADKVDGGTDGGAGATRMLSGDEIDQLAADTPEEGASATDEDIPGTSGRATEGFGTDFGDAAGHASDRKTDLP